MNSHLPTPHDIQRWRPRGLADFVGCEEPKAALFEQIRTNGDGGNTLLEGETGSGKTSLIEAYIRTLFCPHVTDPLHGPCGSCTTCKKFDFYYGDYGFFAHPLNKSSVSGSVTAHFFHINCYGLNESGIRQLVVDIRDAGDDRSIIFLDEIQDLADGKRDRLLLKPIGDLNAVWIATGITTDVLSPMFVRRFATRCRMGLPSIRELALFLHRRCIEWKICYDDSETFVLLAERSRQITAECISVLAHAAGREERRLDRELVLSHPFITGIAR